MKNNIECLDLRHELTINFKIKVYSKFDAGRTSNNYVGYSGLINLIGSDLAVKLIINAINSDDQKIVNNLRRGLKITFYSI